MQLFRPSSYLAQCERCGVRFDPVKGGVCPSCNRILCGTHMYGSWLRRLRSQLGAKLVCAACAAGGPSARSAR
jgi:hypothetical protein